MVLNSFAFIRSAKCENMLTGDLLDKACKNEISHLFRAEATQFVCQAIYEPRTIKSIEMKALKNLEVTAVT